MVNLTTADVNTGCSKAAVGSVLDIKWFWDDNPNRVYDWHATLTAKATAQPPAPAKVFFPKGQRGMPAIAESAGGLTADMPCEGVTYVTIHYEAAADVSAFQLHTAQEALSNGEKPPVMPFELHEPISWACQMEANALGSEQVKTRLSVELGGGPSASRARIHAINAIHLWIDAANEVAEWWSTDSFVRLGRNLVRHAREQIAYDVHKVTSAEIAKETAEADFGTDELGAAIAKIRGSRKEKKATRGAKTWWCTNCRKQHSAGSECPEATTKSGNGLGGGSKNKSMK